MRNGDISDVSHPTSGEKPSAADQRSRRLCLTHKVPGLRDSLSPERQASGALLKRSALGRLTEGVAAVRVGVGAEGT